MSQYAYRSLSMSNLCVLVSTDIEYRQGFQAAWLVVFSWQPDRPPRRPVGAAADLLLRRPTATKALGEKNKLKIVSICSFAQVLSYNSFLQYTVCLSCICSLEEKGKYHVQTKATRWHCDLSGIPTFRHSKGVQSTKCWLQVVIQWSDVYRCVHLFWVTS